MPRGLSRRLDSGLGSRPPAASTNKWGPETKTLDFLHSTHLLAPAHPTKNRAEKCYPSDIYCPVSLSFDLPVHSALILSDFSSICIHLASIRINIIRDHVTLLSFHVFLRMSSFLLLTLLLRHRPLLYIICFLLCACIHNFQHSIPFQIFTGAGPAVGFQNISWKLQHF